MTSERQNVPFIMVFKLLRSERDQQIVRGAACHLQIILFIASMNIILSCDNTSVSKKLTR